MMTKLTRSIAASIGLAFAAAACSGGSAGLAPSAPASPAAAGSGSAIFVVQIPHPATTASDVKRPAYLTPQVQGIDFSVSASDGTLPTNRGYAFFALTPQSTYCTNGVSALTCTLSLQAYPGNDAFSVTTYDQANPTTPYPNNGSSHVVSVGYVNATIGTGAANTISITTAGLVSTVLVGLDNPYPASGTPVSQSVRVTGVDADNNVIVGNFDSPIALTDSDTTGATSLSTGSIPSSGAPATLNYTGGTMGSATIKATTSSPLDVYNRGPFNATTTFQPGSTALWSAPQYLTFGSVGSNPQTITVHGTNAAWSSNSGCVGKVTISSTAPTYTVTPVAAGKCTLQLTYGTPPGTLSTLSIPIVISPN